MCGNTVCVCNQWGEVNVCGGTKMSPAPSAGRRESMVAGIGRCAGRQVAEPLPREGTQATAFGRNTQGRRHVCRTHVQRQWWCGGGMVVVDLYRPWQEQERVGR